MINFTKTIFTILFLQALTGCDYSLKNQIENYNGDGTIKYLSAPGFLGLSGCSITMPKFKLNAGHQNIYKLSGIPQGKNYIVFLVIPSEDTFEKIKNNTFSYTVKSNDEVILTNSSTIKELIKTSKGNESTRSIYFLDQDNNKTDFSVNESNATLTLEVQYTNNNFNEAVKGHLLISRGGYK